MTEVRDPPVHDLTPEDVARGLAQGKVLLVDVREPNEYQICKIEGSTLIPLGIPSAKAAQVSPSVPAAEATQAASSPLSGRSW